MTIDQEEHEIFDRPAISKWRRIDSLNYAFELKGIPNEILVRLTESRKPKGFNFRLSHLALTPTQGEPHRSDANWDRERLGALRTAIYVITMHYDDAVKKGFEPHMNWLVVNDIQGVAQSRRKL
jgi:hypothetical protein